MAQTTPRLITFTDFVKQYGDDSRYELIDGELIDRNPTGPDEQVAAFVGRKLNVEIDRQDADYFVPHRCLLKGSGTVIVFRPDVTVLDRAQITQEPLWQQEPVITSGSSVKLIVEVVSANWQNDYARKAKDYALLGIQEYWIVDYLGLGGREHTGNPKQPTITICTLAQEFYQKQLFRSDDQLKSSLFSSLNLTANQIFSSINS